MYSSGLDARCSQMSDCHELRPRELWLWQIVLHAFLQQYGSRRHSRWKIEGLPVLTDELRAQQAPRAEAIGARMHAGRMWSGSWEESGTRAGFTL